MTANRDLILAGIAAGGAGGTALANFAPIGTPLPTDWDTTLNAAFVDMGWITEDGLKRAVEVESTDLKAYGSVQPVRTLKTTRKATFEITFMESSPNVISVYNELPLGSITPDAEGAFSVTEGLARTQTYSAVFDIVDGDNVIRAIAPTVEVTGTKEFEAKAGSAILYGVTLTAYPGGDGTAIEWIYKLDALAA